MSACAVRSVVMVVCEVAARTPCVGCTCGWRDPTRRWAVWGRLRSGRPQQAKRPEWRRAAARGSLWPAHQHALDSLWYSIKKDKCTMKEKRTAWWQKEGRIIVHACQNDGRMIDNRALCLGKLSPKCRTMSIKSFLLFLLQTKVH